MPSFSANASAALVGLPSLKAAVSAFYEILELMPEEQREVFVLHDLEQMKGREIAQITDTNENTVHTRLRAARRIFQEGVARLNAEELK